MRYYNHMKKITCSLLALLLLGCGRDENQCPQIHNINWANHDQSIKIYSECIGDSLNTPDDELANLADDKIDSMLYLSYIYLTDTEHYDWDAAIQLLDVATKSMLQKCLVAKINDSYTEHYDNYCTHNYDFISREYDPTPKKIETLDDAMFVYHMSLPCVYMDMIRENERALELIDSWFGSTRDLAIPHVCEYNLDGKFLEFDKFFSDSAIDYLESLNPYGFIEGTIRFGYRTSEYHDLIYMLTYPTHFFKSDNIADIYVSRTKYCDFEEDAPDCESKDFTITVPELEKQIYKNKSAARGYNKMIDSLAKYYVSKLKMSDADAKKYARMSAAQIMLQYIYMR